MLEKTKSFIARKRAAALVASAGALSNFAVTSAGGTYQPSQKGEAFDGIDSSMGIIISWIQWGGMAIAFFGVLQLILAFQRDDSEGKSRGVHTLIVGGMLAAASIFAQQFGLGQ